MKPRVLGIFQNFSLTLIAFACLIFLTEFALGFFPKFQINQHKLFCEYDSLLGWRKIPNYSGISSSFEYAVVEEFNSKGLRGPEYSYEKDLNEWRVLILGDSFAEGYTVGFENLFSEILKKELNQSLKPTAGVIAEVINAGTGGYSTDQELLFFESEGYRYQPDVVILLFFDNDVWFNAQPAYWRGSKPVFSLQDSELVLNNVPVPKPDESNVRLSWTKQLKGWLRRNSHLYLLAHSASENSDFLRDWLEKIGVKQSGIPDEFRVYQNNPDPDIDDAWAVTEKLIERFRDQTKASGAKFLLFYVNPQEAINPESWARLKKRYQLDSAEWDIGEVWSRLGGICKKYNIDCLNPRDIFEKETQQSGTLFFEQDGHWNEKGHRLVAKILANYLASHDLIKSS